jgi:hypothetical protein
MVWIVIGCATVGFILISVAISRRRARRLDSKRAWDELTADEQQFVLSCRRVERGGIE